MKNYSKEFRIKTLADCRPAGEALKAQIFELNRKLEKALALIDRKKEMILAANRRMFDMKSEHSKGGAVIAMAVIRTALRNGLAPSLYLKWVFENIKTTRHGDLLPWSKLVPEE